MKSYVLTTGILFLALLGAHIARASQERQLMRDPWFLLTTVISLALVIWAWRLFRRLTTAPADS
jgi:hypothetical protein